LKISLKRASLESSLSLELLLHFRRNYLSSIVGKGILSEYSYLFYQLLAALEELLENWIFFTIDSLEILQELPAERFLYFLYLIFS
jgi:hypothetical protein